MSKTPSRSKALRLDDVARAAGVSLPTTSRALSGHPDVRHETREKVLRVAAELGYQPSAAARALRTGRHRAVSIVMPFGGAGWWEPLLRGAAEEARRRGYHLTLDVVGQPEQANQNLESASFMGLLDRVTSWPVDGCVLLVPSDDEWKSHPRLNSVPVVIIDDQRSHPDFHVWCSDNYTGARAAVRHLLDQGRTKIVAIAPLFPHHDEPSGFDPVAYRRERLAGYRDVMVEAGLTVQVEYTAETYPPVLDTSDVMDRLLGAGSDVDAVFTVNDFCAYAVIRSLARAGRDVPGDVAVIGFDGDPAGDAVNPRLTTVAQPFPAIGAGAVGTLIDLIEGHAEPPRRHQLEPTLIRKGTA